MHIYRKYHGYRNLETGIHCERRKQHRRKPKQESIDVTERNENEDASTRGEDDREWIDLTRREDARALIARSASIASDY